MKIVKTQLGTIEVFQFIELEIGPEVQTIFDNATLAELSKTPWLFPTYVDADGAMSAISQSFVVTLGKRVVVVDTCIGNDKPRLDLPQWGKLQTNFIEGFGKIGLRPGDVTDVLCTHLHADHIGWNTTLKDGAWQPTFSNAKYYFARSEYEHVDARPPTATADTLAAFVDSIEPVVAAGLAVFVDADADLGDGVSLIPTPGHTIGHVSVRIQVGAVELYISGDAIHHPCQIARSNWSTNIDHDPARAATSRKALLAKAGKAGAYLAGTHFSVPSIGTLAPTPDGEFVFRGSAYSPEESV